MKTNNTETIKCLKCGGTYLTDYTYGLKGKDKKEARKNYYIIICGTCGKDYILDRKYKGDEGFGNILELAS